MPYDLYELVTKVCLIRMKEGSPEEWEEAEKSLLKIARELDTLANAIGDILEFAGRHFDEVNIDVDDAPSSED